MPITFSQQSGYIPRTLRYVAFLFRAPITSANKRTLTHIEAIKKPLGRCEAHLSSDCVCVFLKFFSIPVSF